MRTFLTMLLVLAGGFAASPLCAAAEFFYMDHDRLTERYVGAVGPLVLSGDIEPGDYDRLLARIAADPDRFFEQNQMILASEQGDVAEALRIAALVRAMFSEVTVGPLTGRCSGACFLIYAAASQRATDGDGLIGIRRQAGVGAFLEDNGVPAALMAELDATPTQVYWLTREDERLLGNRSAAFAHYLKVRCGWDEAVEREAYTGVRPLSDLRAALACRNGVTRADGRKALAAALAARSRSK